MDFRPLTNFLRQIPAVRPHFGTGEYEPGLWYIKFRLDLRHPLAWQVVQEIGHVINYLSINERLPTIFYPVSPPPYLNGGPEEYLSWVIKNKDAEFTPAMLSEWLEGRLPKPVGDVAEWSEEE